MARAWRVVCAVLSLASCATSKQTYEGVDTAAEYAFLDKFVFDFSFDDIDQQRGHFELSAQSDVPGTWIALFSDQDASWGVASSTTDCQTKLLASKYRVEIPEGGSVHSWLPIRQHVRPRFWYLMAFNCNPDTVHFGIHVHYFAHWTNFGSAWWNELSVEEQGVPQMSLVFAIGYWCASVLVLKKLQEIREERLFHPSFRILCASIVLECVSMTLTTVHYFEYSTNGMGSPPTYFIAEVCNVISELALITMVVLLSQGWSVDPIHHTLKYRTLLYPVGSFYVLLYVLLFFSQFWYSDTEADSGIFWESLPGQMICLLRVIVCVVVVASALSTAHGELNPVRAQFYMRMCFVMAMWLVTLPVVVAVALVLAPYVRFRVVFTLQATTKAVALAYMSLLLWPQSNPAALFSFGTRAQEQLEGHARGEISAKHKGRPQLSPEELEVMQHLSEARHNSLDEGAEGDNEDEEEGRDLRVNTAKWT